MRPLPLPKVIRFFLILSILGFFLFRYRYLYWPYGRFNRNNHWMDNTYLCYSFFDSFL